MCLDDFPEFIGNLIQSFIPRNALKSISNTFKRKSQSFRVILKVSYVCPFPAKIAFRAGVLFVTPDFDDLASFGDHFKAAVVKTENTGCLLPFAHDPILS
jgi:hypothetical protein